MGRETVAVTQSHLYFEAWVDGGNYGSVGIDLRIMNVAAPTGWQNSMGYTPNALIDEKNYIGD